MAGEAVEVVVGKDPQRRPAEPRPVDEGGVAELVEDDDVILPAEGGIVRSRRRSPR